MYIAKFINSKFYKINLHLLNKERTPMKKARFKILAEKVEEVEPKHPICIVLNGTHLFD